MSNGEPIPQSEAAQPAGLKASLRAGWPIPLLFVSIALLTAGVVTAMKSRPKVDPTIPLKEAEVLVAAHEWEKAVAVLNDRVRGFVDSAGATDEHRARFRIARARAFAGAILLPGADRAENHRVVVEDFVAAEKLGLVLEPGDVSRLVESLVAVGRIDDAVRRMNTLPRDDASRRVRLTRLVIEACLRDGAGRESQTLELLGALAVEPSIGPPERAWVLARQAEMLIAAGRAEEAITKLLRDMQRLRDVPPSSLGELHLRLGEAYMAAGNEPASARQLEMADGLLDEHSALRAEAALMLGRLLKAGAGTDAEQTARAADRFAVVVNEYSTSPSYLPAVLELAEIDSAGGDHGAACERYAELVEAVRRPGAVLPRGLSAERVYASLFERQTGRFLSADYPTSLRYGELAASLFDDSKIPSALLLALAQTHRASADAVLGAAEGHVSGAVDRLDPATRSELKRHLLAAGEWFRRHAERVSAEDTSRYLDSRWLAADSFDLAGDMEEAKREFALYADGAPDDDARRPKARYRLAQVFQVERDYTTAAALFREAMAASGAVSDRARVPLARCLLADGDPSNDAEAERLLISTVDGSVVGPDASAFREALIELAGVYYSTGRHAEAIARLEEALSRFPDDSRAPILRYKLADANRLSAAQIAQTLRQGLPQATRETLEQERADRLRNAAALYERVRSELESVTERRLTELERVCLRNAYFAIGDCAFDLGDDETAIAAYDAARLAYAEDPSSLVAMVQIVNAYVRQGRWTQARTANERARQHLARFPDEVWQRPDMPMEKKHWERWLDSRTLLEQSARAEP
ncbi:MAG: tetratricopeptide repeat protein [Phycisphaeraceae bacterium]|nr:tetratricopeptide repeat protein [Phycisphaeraceae bacterium]